MNPTDVRPFVAVGNTITVSATAASSATSLGTTGRGGNPDMPATARVYNAGTGLAFVKFGASTDTAAVTSDTSVPIASGNTETFWVPAAATHVVIIVAAAGTATVYVTLGQGI